MNDELKAAKAKAEATYNAAADCYEDGPLRFWKTYGQRTVDRLELRKGFEVLDVCCGAGASALPAARTVGPDGKVIAVDLADRLLELGRASAAAEGLHCLEFRRADMTALEFPDAQFDAVVCVFGIFFVPDMQAQIAKLWKLVKPGGQLAITTWGPDIFAPGYEIWQASIREERPDLHAAFNPWDRITTKDAVEQLFHDAGVSSVDVVPERGHQDLEDPADFWTIALGSGLRWIVEQLGPERANVVRKRVIRELTEQRVTRVQTNVIYAIARRPSGSG